MLIHSVSPPHMLTEQPVVPEIETRQVMGGYMEVLRTPQGLQMSRLCSTDLNLYLRAEYAPGQMVDRN